MISFRNRLRTAENALHVTINALIFFIACVLMSQNIFASTMLENLRNAEDNRLLVRQSLGVRSARAIDATHVELILGLSATDICSDANAYRVISFDDPKYPYADFIRPTSASVKKQTEAPGIVASGFDQFTRTIVTLALPSPMQIGKQYHFVAQGVGSSMVTGAHTAASLTFTTNTPTPEDETDFHLAVLGLRSVEPVGPRTLRIEFGPSFNPEAAKDFASWKITINGKPVAVTRLGRMSKLDTYFPRGWPFVPIVMHEIFLELASDWSPQSVIQIQAAPTLTTAAHEATLHFDDHKTITYSIKVNQVGYITDSPVKIAYLGRWMGSFPEVVAKNETDKNSSSTTGEKKSSSGDSGGNAFWEAVNSGPAKPADAPSAAPAKPETAAKNAKELDHDSPAILFDVSPKFQICEALTGKIVFEGQAKLIHSSGKKNEGVHATDHSGENVYVLDFTNLKTDGTYYVHLPNIGRSIEFGIAKDIYQKAFDIQAYGVFAQRSAMELAPPYSQWRRIAPMTQGPIVTDYQSLPNHDLGKLPDHIVMAPVDASAKYPALAALDADPKLLAHWPLDGNLNDVSGHNHPLVAAGNSAAHGDVKFSPDELIFPANQAFGPTHEGDNTLVAQGFSYDPDAGLSVCGWIKHKEKNDFGNRVFGFGETDWNKPKFYITANYGLLTATIGTPAQDLRIERMNDGKWHHLAIVADAKSISPRRTFVYVDGLLYKTGDAPQNIKAEKFYVASMSGKDSDGKYFDDMRAYNRALTTKEIATLATLRGSKPLRLDARGGHHDAGDYNPRSHLDVAQTLMTAYEIAPKKFFDKQLNIPEAGNGIPDIIDEADWALKLWRGLQEADGGVHNGTESNGDPNFIQTVELDTLGDYAFAKDTAGTLNFAGAMAQSSRIYRSIGKTDLAQADLQRALNAWNWAEKQGIPKLKDAEQLGVMWMNPRAYAAAELLRTTGEPRFKQAFAECAVWSKKPDADVDVYKLYDQELAAWAYVKCDPAVADPELQARAKAAILRKANLFIQYSDTMSYKFVRHPWAPISWGTGAYENWLRCVMFAWSLTGDAKYQTWMIRTCDNTLGANPLCTSYIVGLGSRTVRAPLHNSRYSHMGEVVNGMQVEGPCQRAEGYHVADVFFPKRTDDFAVLYTFVDCHFAISIDEGVITTMANTMAVFGLMLPDQP